MACHSNFVSIQKCGKTFLKNRLRKNNRHNVFSVVVCISALVRQYYRQDKCWLVRFCCLFVDLHILQRSFHLDCLFRDLWGPHLDFASLCQFRFRIRPDDCIGLRRVSERPSEAAADLRQCHSRWKAHGSRLHLFSASH